MLPELGQWAVTTLPLSSCTSAMKRLYLLTRMPGISSGQSRPGFFFKVSGVFMFFFLSDLRLNRNPKYKIALAILYEAALPRGSLFPEVVEKLRDRKINS